MLNVFFTVDTEIWCPGWQNLEADFPGAFRRYVYGPDGDAALPLTLRILQASGLLGVFFVEPLFALRFGIEPLAELVGLIRAFGHEIQLHMHTEWVDEARPPLWPAVKFRRRFMREFTCTEQTTLIATGLRLMAQAGVNGINAFRAGSYGFNLDTLRALAANGLTFDTSYNPHLEATASGVASGTVLRQPLLVEGVYEYPVSSFEALPGRGRSTHLTACSTRELLAALDAAHDAGWNDFVIVSHGVELMNGARTRRDPMMVRRFERLCGHLARHPERFQVRGFHGLVPHANNLQPQALRVPLHYTAFRMAEQAMRRLIR